MQTIPLYQVRWVCRMHAKRIAVRVRWGAVSQGGYLAWYR